ncbi:NfeD family protein [Shewanella algidipiscicola]|uniref:NfeD family protein n=1 Tax=Shewanella algidipiscicola TaxID=614070 RepID=UPI001EF495A1|nr:nodulation protein NfeD [Shewanella algidipiscicola]
MTAQLTSARWARKSEWLTHRRQINWQWTHRPQANEIITSIIGLLVMLLLTICASSTAMAQAKIHAITEPQAHTQQNVPLLRFEGAIGPAVSEYLISEITQANQLPLSQRPPLLMITMDTPGGLVSSLRTINQAILASTIPIACLVSPSGARAMSAGTYILYACHVAAMAPATTLGAATPVKMGGPISPPNTPSPKDSTPADRGDKNGSGENNNRDKITPSDNGSAMERKVLNDAVASIRALATLRKRNIDFAERAVTEAATLTATEALAQNVINFIADDAADLLAQLNGTHVDMGDKLLTLTLDNAQLIAHQRSWRNHFIATITDPNVAYILMLIGIYGILLEFYSPGVGVAGVTGAISLLIALYAFQLLPINYVGLGLMLLGISLLVAESMVPSFGIFGLGGAVAFALGSIFLMDSEVEDFSISLPLIGAVTVTALLFSLWVLTTLWRQRQRKPVSGDDVIVGAQAIVVEGFIEKGFVSLDGEHWAAVSDKPTHTAQRVLVLARDHLTLKVTPTSALPAKEIINGRN